MAVTSREVSASATGVALESLRRFVASRFLRVDAPAAAEGIAVISKSVPLCTFEAVVGEDDVEDPEYDDDDLIEAYVLNITV